jgi:hypothetical protein
MGRWTRIHKTHERSRLIYIPTREEKDELRRLIPKLRRMCYLEAKRRRVYDTIHGFWPGRSPITAALRHVGARSAISLDLKDFFDSCTYERFARVVDEEKAKEFLCAFRKHPQTGELVAAQGLPTSPMVSNICFLPVDSALNALAFRRGLTYTRYADDITISSPCEETDLRALYNEVVQIIESWGFRVERHKTRFWRARGGRLIVCGVAVDEQGIHPTRRAKRKLRAALHQGRVPQARGLSEWVALRAPLGYFYSLRHELINKNNISKNKKQGWTWGCDSRCRGRGLMHFPFVIRVLRRSLPTVEIIKHMRYAAQLQRSLEVCYGALLHTAATEPDKCATLARACERLALRLEWNDWQILHNSVADALANGNIDEALSAVALYSLL